LSWVRAWIGAYQLDKALIGEKAEVVKSDKYITDRALKDYLASSVSVDTNNMHNIEQNQKAILDSNCENIIVEI